MIEFHTFSEWLTLSCNDHLLLLPKRYAIPNCCVRGHKVLTDLVAGFDLYHLISFHGTQLDVAMSRICSGVASLDYLILIPHRSSCLLQNVNT